MRNTYPVERLEEIKEIVCDFFGKLFIQVGRLLYLDEGLYILQGFQLQDQLQLWQQVHRRIQRPARVKYVRRPLICNGTDKLKVFIRRRREVESGYNFSDNF